MIPVISPSICDFFHERSTKFAFFIRHKLKFATLEFPMLASMVSAGQSMKLEIFRFRTIKFVIFICLINEIHNFFRYILKKFASHMFTLRGSQVVLRLTLAKHFHIYDIKFRIVSLHGANNKSNC